MIDSQINISSLFSNLPDKVGLEGPRLDLETFYVYVSYIIDEFGTEQQQQELKNKTPQIDESAKQSQERIGQKGSTFSKKRKTKRSSRG